MRSSAGLEARLYGSQDECRYTFQTRSWLLFVSGIQFPLKETLPGDCYHRITARSFFHPFSWLACCRFTSVSPSIVAVATMARRAPRRFAVCRSAPERRLHSAHCIRCLRLPNRLPSKARRFGTAWQRRVASPASYRTPLDSSSRNSAAHSLRCSSLTSGSGRRLRRVQLMRACSA